VTTKPLFEIDSAAASPRRRVAGSHARTSDWSRPRAMALAALATATAAAVAIAISGGRLVREPPAPRSLPHAQVACVRCHGATPIARECATCHAEHRSTRKGHAALAARGQLTCTTCHAGHGDSQQGVRFDADGAFVRWGGDGEAHGRTQARANAGDAFALVPLAACARCHDASRSGDPIRRCVADPANARALTTCFDEHPQKRASRVISAEAAREAALAVPWVRSKNERRLPWAWLAAGPLAGALAFVAFGRLRAKRRDSQVAPAPPERVRLPIIDTSTCLGCYACVDACAFNVLEIQRYVAVVARPKDCCGALTCERACPNGSLRVAMGDPIAARPRVDEHLESTDARGVFLAGDLTGLPLIKNAIAQGTGVVDHIARAIAKSERGAFDADLVVVGSGPAGLAAALRAQEKGLSCIVLEQGSVASTIRAFPRDKLVYDAPLELPVEGALWLRESTKEELLAQWTRIVRARRVDVREGHRVVGVERRGDGFAVVAQTASGERRFSCARLLLAIGRRGTPRPLDATIEPGAERALSYSLADARSFAGKRVVVVGLGDSAMETAIALARQPATRVTVSYRGKDFVRGKARNIEPMRRLVETGRVRVVWESTAVRVDARAITLRVPGGSERIACDAVIVQIGGVPSWDLVAAAGVVVSAHGRAG
jgi:thioredoxin reductase